MTHALKTVLKVVGLVLLAVFLLLALLVFRIITAPMVPNNYTRTVETGGVLEAVYLAMGGHKVKYREAKADDVLKKYEIYYPAALEEGEGTYPAVLFVNGTGVYGSKYKALFWHLASWGFIVVGNEDPSTWTGTSSDRTLAYLLAENGRADSPFYQRVDLENIGISGHSQGGAGVFNAITDNEHSSLYKTAVALSPTHEEGAAALGWHYDLTRIHIPILLAAGTEGDFETQLVLPLEAMERMYEKLSVPKAMLRKTGCEHGQTLYAADGYVTAWFLWQLQGDAEAGKAFTGQHPELLENPLYQDVRLSIESGDSP